MADPFLAEITITGFNFAPRGWALCDGQIVSINQNQALYSLLGTTFGGDGRTTFGLPDLRGRSPMHVGNDHGINNPLGRKHGTENVQLTVNEMPAHTHDAGKLTASNVAGTDASPLSQVPAVSASPLYAEPLAGSAVGSSTLEGGNQPHNNMQPFLTLNFCIATQGTFPSRN